MNLTIKLTSLTSLFLKSPRILQCRHGTNSSKGRKKKKKKASLTKMPLPEGDVLHIDYPHFRTKKAFFFFNLSGVLTLIMLQILT